MDVGTPQDLGHSSDTESTQIPSTQHDSLQRRLTSLNSVRQALACSLLPCVTCTNLPTWG